MSDWDPAGLERVRALARDRGTTGLVVQQGGRTVVEEHWLPDAPVLGREVLPDGRTREDVASAQKSVTSLLVGTAVERGLVDLDTPVSAVLGPGWTRLPEDLEARISLRHLLTMTSGLDDHLQVVAAPGERWFYNLGAAYHSVKRVLSAVAGEDLGVLSEAWLFGPLGLTETAWAERPVDPALPEHLRDFACYPDGRPFEALVSSARDLARLGTALLEGSGLPTGYLAQALAPATPLNPAYGLLWWLNGGAWHLEPRRDDRVEGWLVPDAPVDLVCMLGAHGRSVHVVPSRGLVVVRLGADPGDSPLAASRFGRDLWSALRAAAPDGETWGAPVSR